MPRNVNLKIVTVITALTVAIIALSITTVILRGRHGPESFSSF